MKYPVIDGREIVPVRLIPLIANAWLGQEVLSGILANRVKVNGWLYPSDHSQKERENGVHAYHLNDDGIPLKMWFSEWDAIYREIKLLEPVLRKAEEINGVPDSMEFAWKLKATKVLPPAVFLWRDDLDLLWEAHISTFTRNTEYDPPDFRKMNHNAYIRPEYRKLVWEGFEHLKTGISTVTSLKSEKQKNDSSTTTHHDEPSPTQDLKERGDPFNRKGIVVPKEKRRGTSTFTDVMDYLFQLCRDTGKGELLVPGNPDGFMENAKTLIKEDKKGKKQDHYLAERIAKVRYGSDGFFEMQQGHGRTKPRKGIDAYKYPRIEIQKELSVLRKRYSQSVK